MRLDYAEGILPIFRPAERRWSGLRKAGDIQSVVRALEVLEALNERSVSTVDDLHRATGLPKPTLVRILGTLASLGYVFHVSRRDGYALTEKVLRLSAGFQHNDAIVDIARPLMEAFTAHQKWQLSIATLEVDAMRVRFNTRHMSPFAPDQRFLNRRIGMLTSALGRAYLAYCPEDERAAILKFVAASTPEVYREATQRIDVDSLVRRVRTMGYATIERPPGDKVRSFAVPILSLDDDPHPVGALALFYFSSAMTEAQATERYLDELHEIGRHVAEGLSGVSAMAANA